MNQQTAIATRPNKAAARSLSECKSLDEALRTDEIKGRIAAALPRHMSPDRMLRVMALATYQTPKLKEASMMEVLGAMVALASLGLEPNTPLGHAYLIPFTLRRNKPDERTVIQTVLGYRGMLDLARRSGAIKSIHADVVYPGDEFTFEYGSQMHLRHVPKGDRSGEPVWAYAHSMLADGEAFEVLPWAQVLIIRNQSQGYQSAKRFKNETPWDTHLHEMAAKTMIRRLWKYLPMSIEMMNAEAFDAASDRSAGGFAQILDASPVDLQEVGPGALIGGETADAEPVEADRDPEARQQDEKPAADPTPRQQAKQQAPRETAAEPEPEAKDEDDDFPGDIPAGDGDPEPWPFYPLRGTSSVFPTVSKWAEHFDRVLGSLNSPKAVAELWRMNAEMLDRLDRADPEEFETLRGIAREKGASV